MIALQVATTPMTDPDVLLVLGWLTLTLPVTLLGMGVAGAVVRWINNGSDAWEIPTHQTPAASTGEPSNAAGRPAAGPGGEAHRQPASSTVFIDDVLEGRWA